MINRAYCMMFTLAVMCLPRLAPAGCPAMGSMDAGCTKESSSIEGCTNAIWEDYQFIKLMTAGLERDPRNAGQRLAMIRDAKLGIPAKAVLLGSAPVYEHKGFLAGCYPLSNGARFAIDRCIVQLRSARWGRELLSKQEIVTALSYETREKLKAIFAKQAAHYESQLDVIAASWPGDPEALCGEIYASVPACERAIAMDTDALHRQVFPVYRCGQMIPGQFVTAADAAEEARPTQDITARRAVLRDTFTFSDAVRFYQERLDREKALLAKTRKTQ